MFRARRWLLAGLAVGAVVRLLLLPVPGTPDVGSWKIWAVVGASDPTALYGVGGTPPERRLISWNGMSGTTEYPPAALYQMGFVGAIYAQLDPLFIDSPTFTALIKAPGLVAEVAFLLAIWAWRRRLGDGAAWIALAYWLNPAIVLNGAALGYLDAQMAVPATLSLIAASIGMPTTAGALVTLAILTKAQAIFIAPVVLLALLQARQAHWRPTMVDACAGGLSMFILIVGPIILRGAWLNMLQALGRLGAHDMLSGYGLNVWWIVTWLVRAIYAIPDLDWVTAFTMPVRILGIGRFMEIGGPNPKLIGAVVVIGAVGWAIWRARHETRLPMFALRAAWSVYTYSMFSAQVHENHAYLAVPLLVIAAGTERALRPLFWAVSLMTAMNMYVFYGLGDGRPLVISRSSTIVDLTVVLSFVNVGVYVWFTRSIGRGRKADIGSGHADREP